MIDFAVTFDVDWAPDWAILECAEICEKARIPATFFVTHESDVLTDVSRNPEIFELGIHPNFLPGSSHGGTEQSVFEHCLKIVPDARAMRTHALCQSTPILNMARRDFSIEIDVSLLLPFHGGLKPTRFFVRDAESPLIRLPYNWEDDVAAEWPGWDWTQNQPATDNLGPGLKIMAFHPIHVALNTGALVAYENLKQHLGGRPLWSVTRSEIDRFKESGSGTRTFLEGLVQSVNPESCGRISDLPTSDAA